MASSTTTASSSPSSFLLLEIKGKHQTIDLLRATVHVLNGSLILSLLCSETVQHQLSSPAITDAHDKKVLGNVAELLDPGWSFYVEVGSSLNHTKVIEEL